MIMRALLSTLGSEDWKLCASELTLCPHSRLMSRITLSHFTERIWICFVFCVFFCPHCCFHLLFFLERNKPNTKMGQVADRAMQAGWSLPCLVVWYWVRRGISDHCHTSACLHLFKEAAREIVSPQGVVVLSCNFHSKEKGVTQALDTMLWKQAHKTFLCYFSSSLPFSFLLYLHGVGIGRVVRGWRSDARMWTWTMFLLRCTAKGL